MNNQTNTVQHRNMNANGITGCAVKSVIDVWNRRANDGK